MGKRIAIFFGLMLLQSICNANPNVMWSNCFDVTGQAVAFVDEPGSRRLEATFHNDKPTVIWDSEFAGQLSLDARTFLYAHACAHHALGHTYSLVPEDGEERANCWAANTLLDVGIFVKRDLFKIAEELNELPEKRKVPMLQRNLSLKACFQSEELQQVSIENTYKEFEPNCHQAMVEEEYEEIETITRPEQVPCEHCNCQRWGDNPEHPYSDCVCDHAFDMVDRMVEVRVTKIRYVPKEVCEPKSEPEN